MKNTSKLYALLKYAAISGNLMYILWILYNGINEGFNAPPAMFVSYIGILLLLMLNIILLYKKRDN